MREMTRKSNLDALKGQAKKCFQEKRNCVCFPALNLWIILKKEYKTKCSLEVVMD